MAAPTTAARVKKALANPEPSTHGPMPSEFLMAAALVARSAVPRMRDRAFCLRRCFHPPQCGCPPREHGVRVSHGGAFLDQKVTRIDNPHLSRAVLLNGGLHC